MDDHRSRQIAAPNTKLKPPRSDEATAPLSVKLRLKELRSQIAQHGWHFNVGPTSVSGKRLRDVTGLVTPSAAYMAELVTHQNQIATEILKLEQEAIKAFEDAAVRLGLAHLPEVALRAKLPSPSAIGFDWTPLSKVSPVRYQGTCGSCWAFASVSALESSILIRYNAGVELSPQYVMDNAVFSSCNGGFPPEAFTSMMTLGTAKESDVPYQGKKFGPRAVFDNPYRALIWGFVGNGFTASIEEIKLNLLLHGPLVVAMFASDAFENYTGGTYDAFDMPNANEIVENKGPTNHVVTLVGWDDAKQAWHIKNSWGATWGEQGFGWVRYGSNLIANGAFWIEALNTNLQLPKVLLEWLEKAKELARQMSEAERQAAEAADRALTQVRNQAQKAAEQAEHAAKDAEGKAAAAAAKQKLAEAAQKQVAKAKNDAERRAGEAAARAAQEASQQAAAAAKQARQNSDRVAHAAQDAANAAKKALSGHAPALPDPRKHLPKFP